LPLPHPPPHPPPPTPACHPRLQVSGYSERNVWVRDPPQTTRVQRDQIVQSVDRSLQRLGTDVIDLLQVHW
jgi:diketogulonate reductase-like aldo/keto reductase